MPITATQALQACLAGVPRSQVCSLVYKQPNVLATPVERVQRRVAELSALLAPMGTVEAVGVQKERNKGRPSTPMGVG